MKHATRTQITRRPADERGAADHGWLQARHSFSFANYYDPRHMGFRDLRVINDDRIAGGMGFGSHPHRDMEIFTYIKQGALEHKDDFGNGRIIRAGEFQYMSAGKGVVHSEFNPSPDEEVRLLQIWIEPNEQGGEPRYQDFNIADRKVADGLTLLASPDGREGSIAIRQQAEIHFGELSAGRAIELPPDAPLEHAWIQLISGSLQVGEEGLETGDGAAISGGPVNLVATKPAEFLLFKLS